jgi:protein involved in sex pheromone biosynthesis
MRLRIVAMAATLILSGCGTADDVQKTGVVWQGAVAARYDQLANCLSKQTTLYYKAALKFEKNEQRATVTFSIPVTGIPVEVYDLRQTSDDVTQVSWSTRLERGQHQAGKPFYLMDLCGASPLPATPSPAR